MKIRLMSDLHLEFEDRVLNFTPMPQPDDKDTILILAGDVATGIDAVSFIQKMCKQFRKVVYVLGNHEFYYNEYNKVRAQWNDRPEMPGNFILLDDHVAIVDDVRLVGGTLWTSFNDSDWHAMHTAQHNMNDFHCVKFHEKIDAKTSRKRKFLPQDAVRAHMVTRMLITETLREPFDGKTIVVTHHLPHPLSVPGQFKTSALNAAYMTNLDSIIEQNDIAVWCHGHTHDNVNVEVHGTRILCNPRGYTPDGLNDEFDQNFSFEV